MLDFPRLAQRGKSSMSPFIHLSEIQNVPIYSNGTMDSTSPSTNRTFILSLCDPKS
jgi:hypothetical protein